MTVARVLLATLGELRHPIKVSEVSEVSGPSLRVELADSLVRDAKFN